MAYRSNYRSTSIGGGFTKTNGTVVSSARHSAGTPRREPPRVGSKWSRGGSDPIGQVRLLRVPMSWNFIGVPAHRDPTAFTVPQEIRGHAIPFITPQGNAHRHNMSLRRLHLLHPPVSARPPASPPCQGGGGGLNSSAVTLG